MSRWVPLLIGCSALGCGDPQSSPTAPPSDSQAVSATAQPNPTPLNSGREVVPASASEPSTSSRQHPDGMRLNIQVTGFENSGGTCRLALFQGEAGFNDPTKAIDKKSVDIQNGEAHWEVVIPKSADRSPETKYAVSAYGDTNGNGKLDKNTFGIPTERYGFSRNPKRGFGPPKFHETAFQLQSTDDGIRFPDGEVASSIEIVVH